MSRCKASRRLLFLALCVLVPAPRALAGAQTGSSAAPLGDHDTTFTHADTLRGSDTPQRAWWDVSFYDLHVAVSPADSSIRGWNGITYRVLRPASEMQIDLQPPLVVDSMMQRGRALPFRRDGSAFLVTLAAPQTPGTLETLAVYYHGKPRAAKRPPWDGGLIWAHDSLGRPWTATANEGLGASAWWPNKDFLADEPDSQRIAVTVPEAMFDVSNGRLRDVSRHEDGTATYEWFVRNPINNYDVAINAGRYAHLADSFHGELGVLTLDFYPLAYHADTARVQWGQVKPMLRCFEHWFGPYPWYSDGYKLVEAPHLGMEHQSAVAYGNRFQNGYLGHDLSGTGLGMAWDFIIVHESGHEWFGNNITVKDAADMWVHEGFTNYAENLYTECQMGKEAGAAYVIGTRRLIRNDRPIVAPYGVNAEGSGDMYYKAGNMLHTIRQVIGDDERWRGILRGLNRTFWHQTVTGAQVEAYVSQAAGMDLGPVFTQYLRTTKVPVLEYRIGASTLAYRWANVVPGFRMPVRVTVAKDRYERVTPDETWQTTAVHLDSPGEFRVDPNFYVDVREVAVWR